MFAYLRKVLNLSLNYLAETSKVSAVGKIHVDAKCLFEGYCPYVNQRQYLIASVLLLIINQIYFPEFKPITPMMIKLIDTNLLSVIDSRNKIIPMLAIRVAPNPDQTE